MDRAGQMRTCLVAVFLSLLPALSFAQSGIAGVVKDPTGLALPGVTVEASSDVLIERTRSVVTDGEGQYRFVDLRPGTYDLTYALAGFSTLKREGVNLPADFVASINAEMRLGSLEESLTVTADGPLVDVQSTGRSQVLTREVLDAIPTGRSFQSVGQLVVGVTLSRPDVGGSQAMQQTYFASHGMTSRNTTVQVDGMMMNSTRGDNQVNPYFNDAMNQEVSYETTGSGADVSAGGVRINMIPREGGNRFGGAAFTAWSDGAWQANNLTDSLRAKGLTAVDKIERIFDFNFSIGGPVKQDKLWFFTSARAWGVDSPVGDVFYTPANVPYPTGYVQCKSGTVSCEQAIDDQMIKSAMLRLTWQMSPRNKLGAYYDRLYKTRGHDMTAGVDPRTASFTWRSPVYYTTQIKWTSTVTNRLLVDAGYGSNVNITVQNMQEGIEKGRGTSAWYAGAARLDRDLGTAWAATNNIPTFVPTKYLLQSSASYVTGSHAIKFGVQYQRGWFETRQDAQADLEQDYRTGVPDSVVVRNTPFRYRDSLNYDLGIYVQDSWRYRRLTLNGGLRFEKLNAENSPLTSPAGRFAPARSFSRVPDLPDWTDIAPRFGSALDLFGNGTTALKFSINRYNDSRTTGVAAQYNPLALATARLTWRDLNGDDIAQGELGCVYLTPNCEINFGQLPANFGIRSLRTYDPGTERPYNVMMNIGVQQQLLRNVSVTAAMIDNRFHSLPVRDNVLRTRADYTPVTVYSPLDGSAITVYNLAPGKVTQVQEVDTTATADRKQLFRGYEFTMNSRLPGGVTIFGGAAIERNLTVTCDEPDNPNFDRYCDQRTTDVPFTAQFKLAGSYPLPWLGIQLGGTFQSYPGALVGTTSQLSGTTWLITPTTRYAADCKGGCTPGALVFPTLSEASLTVPLRPYGTEFLDRLNQLDLRGAKVFKLGRYRLEGQLEVFNVLNSDAALTVRGTNYGTAAYQQASGAVQGRITRVGAQLKW
ncbi:MAG TPA: TonB-dependent receptor [Vicinamibacterales bacterium]|nr:TonB-dependent receptor [Vicinamibacterales bacterium]